MSTTLWLNNRERAGAGAWPRSESKIQTPKTHQHPQHPHCCLLLGRIGGGDASVGSAGPLKHQNRYTWNPDANLKKSETEPSGSFLSFLEITGVCPRCKNQIDWKRRYGKYKPLTEPAKCGLFGKPMTIFAQAIKNAPERERRTLLRAMNKNNSSGAIKVPPVGDRSREGELFSSSTIDEYAEISWHAEEDNDENEDELHVCE